MALPELLQPRGTCFLVAGHAITPDPLYDDFQPIQGHGRKRKVQTYAPRYVDVSLLLEADEAAAYDDWFENTLIVGNGLFSAKIARIGETVAQYWTAQFVGPPEWQALHKGRWRLSGRLLLTGEGQDDPPNDPALAIEYTVALSGSAALTLGVELEIEYTMALVGGNPIGAEYLIELLQYVPFYELREDGDFWLREDGGKVIRESGSP